MSVVVDASVVVAALVDAGPTGVWAEEILSSGSLHAPELLWVEATSALRRMENLRRITTADANAAREDLMILNPNLFGFEALAERVWELRQTVSSYDAWYVALAEVLNLPLATLDMRLSKSNGPKCRFLVPEGVKP